MTKKTGATAGFTQAEIDLLAKGFTEWDKQLCRLEKVATDHHSTMFNRRRRNIVSNTKTSEPETNFNYSTSKQNSL